MRRKNKPWVVCNLRRANIPGCKIIPAQNTGLDIKKHLLNLRPESGTEDALTASKLQPTANSLSVRHYLIKMASAYTLTETLFIHKHF